MRHPRVVWGDREESEHPTGLPRTNRVSSPLQGCARGSKPQKPQPPPVSSCTCFPSNSPGAFKTKPFVRQSFLPLYS